MPTIDPTLVTSNDEHLLSIITAAPLMPLDDSPADTDTARALHVWLKSRPTISELGLAGLWLLAGDLDRSHEISQRIETIDGSYWHGIMHRREGDYFNAKYWMRRTSGHPVTEQLKNREREYQDALTFVDTVEKAVLKDPSLRHTAQRIQWLEWQLLFGSHTDTLHVK